MNFILIIPDRSLVDRYCKVGAERDATVEKCYGVLLIFKEEDI